MQAGLEAVFISVVYDIRTEVVKTIWLVVFLTSLPFLLAILTSLNRGEIRDSQALDWSIIVV